nr:zinc finger, CCHC-type, retrotransposon Gag domain protein [Tanacetum cinerariifolium]
MVNTRQSTPEFSGPAFDEAVQRAVTTLLPGLTAQITNEIRQNGAGSNANVGRNIEFLRERGNVNNKRNRDGDHIQSANKNNNQRGYGQKGNDGRNYDRQDGNSSQRFYQRNQDQQYNRSSRSSRLKKYTDYTSPPPCDTCGKPHPGKECYRITG